MMDLVSCCIYSCTFPPQPLPIKVWMTEWWTLLYLTRLHIAALLCNARYLTRLPTVALSLKARNIKRWLISMRLFQKQDDSHDGADMWCWQVLSWCNLSVTDTTMFSPHWGHFQWRCMWAVYSSHTLADASSSRLTATYAQTQFM